MHVLARARVQQSCPGAGKLRAECQRCSLRMSIVELWKRREFQHLNPKRGDKAARRTADNGDRLGGNLCFQERIQIFGEPVLCVILICQVLLVERQLLARRLTPDHPTRSSIYR